MNNKYVKVWSSMIKKLSAFFLLSGFMMSCNVTNAAHIHAFPSIDRPDKDLILISENFKEDIEKDNKYIFTDGTIGYEIYFLMPGGIRDTKNTQSLYFYVPAHDGSSSILRLESKSGPFNITRAYKKKVYTEKEDKQVPAFLEVLDKCYNETLSKLGKI